MFSLLASKCGRAIDVVFVVDSSTNVGMTNFNSVKSYLFEVVGLYTIGPTAVQVGIIRYSTSPSAVVTLGRNSDLNSLRLSIESISYLPGSANTAAAINLATEELNANGRNGVPKVLVVITATASDDPDATVVVATNALSQGIELFAIGIGGAVSQQELNSIATDPDSNHVLRAADFRTDSLGDVMNPVVMGTCTGNFLSSCIIKFYACVMQ